MSCPQGLEIKESYCENMKKPATSESSLDPSLLINWGFNKACIDVLLILLLWADRSFQHKKVKVCLYHLIKKNLFLLCFVKCLPNIFSIHIFTQSYKSLTLSCLILQEINKKSTNILVTWSDNDLFAVYFNFKVNTINL